MYVHTQRHITSIIIRIITHAHRPQFMFHVQGSYVHKIDSGTGRSGGGGVSVTAHRGHWSVVSRRVGDMF